MIDGVIYKYTSPSNKVYIGLTINEKERKKSHIKYAKKNPNGYFQRAINKYGFDNLKYEVLFRVRSKDINKAKVILDALEKYFIRKYDSTNESKGYNIALGGSGSKGFKHTEEHKLKLREQFYTSKLNSPEIKEKARLINIARCSKTCYLYTLDNTLVKVYPSVAEATRQTNIANILAVCKGKRKTAGGFIWSYVQLNKINYD